MKYHLERKRVSEILEDAPMVRERAAGEILTIPGANSLGRLTYGIYKGSACADASLIGLADYRNVPPCHRRHGDISLEIFPLLRLNPVNHFPRVPHCLQTGRLLLISSRPSLSRVMLRFIQLMIITEDNFTVSYRYLASFRNSRFCHSPF